MKPVVKVQCLKHTYPDKTVVNLCGLDFVVEEGERVVILGSNGAGKTTLLSHILGLLTPTEGTVEVMGLPPAKNFNTIRKMVGVVFQNVDEQIIGPRVYDDIAFAPRNYKMPKQEVEERVDTAAKMLKIEELLHKIPHYLSGGQKKKVALAGALAMKPSILVMDEPFDALDPKSKTEMVEILNRVNREEKTTLIITTHDINIVPYIADTVYVLYESQVLLKGAPKEIFRHLDVLKKANLEAPILMELFFRLQQRGLTIDLPDNIEAAVDILAEKIKY
jgi:cobalt/nickel transport system ATP-binding protein